MDKAALADSEGDIRPAICVRHPISNKQEKQEMYFCFDCNRAFCSFCQLSDDNRTNHKPHNTIKMQKLIRIRKERIEDIREKLKQYISKHDSTITEMNTSINEKEKQIKLLNEEIDQFVNRLHQKVDDLKVEANKMIKNKVSLLWDRSPIISINKIAEEALANIREVRASIEYEIKRCEMDELTMAERGKEMDALSDKLEAFMQSQIQLPAASGFDLKPLRTQLQASIAQLDREVTRSKEAFIQMFNSQTMFQNPDSVRIVEQQEVPAQKLVLPSEPNKTLVVNGVAQDEDSDIVYMTDSYNPSKIKSLNLKTHLITEVFSSSLKDKLKGLFAVSDRPNRPFIVTTEQTEKIEKTDFSLAYNRMNNLHSSLASIRVNFLRRNASEKLEHVQSVNLLEWISGLSSFATGLNSTVFCAIAGSSTVHEICRTPGTAGEPFGAVAKTHRLPEVIRFICGFQCNEEHRVAASLADNSVRVFRATGEKLCELQKIRAPHDDWNPMTLVGLAEGAFCICSHFTDLTDWKKKYVIELCAADSSGTLSTPRRLMQFTNEVDLLCHLRAAVTSDNTPRIVAVERNSDSFSTAALRVYLLQQN